MADHVELILCVMEVESMVKVWILCRLQRVFQQGISKGTQWHP
ncbi:MAG: hypothetical protein ACLRTA_06530 [Clostridia bacterium]